MKIAGDPDSELTPNAWNKLIKATIRDGSSLDLNEHQRKRILERAVGAMARHMGDAHWLFLLETLARYGDELPRKSRIRLMAVARDWPALSVNENKLKVVRLMLLESAEQLELASVTLETLDELPPLDAGVDLARELTSALENVAATQAQRERLRELILAWMKVPGHSASPGMAMLTLSNVHDESLTDENLGQVISNCVFALSEYPNDRQWSRLWALLMKLFRDSPRIAKVVQARGDELVDAVFARAEEEPDWIRCATLEDAMKLCRGPDSERTRRRLAEPALHALKRDSTFVGARGWPFLWFPLWDHEPTDELRSIAIVWCRHVNESGERISGHRDVLIRLYIQRNEKVVRELARRALDAAPPGERTKSSWKKLRDLVDDDADNDLETEQRVPGLANPE